MLWNLVEIYTHFERMLCFHLKGRRISFSENGGIKFLQTLVSLYQTTWHHNPSGSMLHCYYSENFRSHRRKAWSILVYSDAWVTTRFPLRAWRCGVCDNWRYLDKVRIYKTWIKNLCVIIDIQRLKSGEF